MCQIKYTRNEWKLVTGNLVRHGLGMVFAIEPSEAGLTANLVNLEYEVLQTDVDALTKFAVTAYLDLIGWERLAGVKQGLKPS